MKKLLTVACVLTIGALQTWAQFFSMPLPTNNVMNSQHIRCITQDKQGFLWMGSGTGLYRYDGYQYQRIRETQHPELLPDESVLNIANWGSRYLWIRLRGDVYSCYDIDQGCFVDWNGDMGNNEPYRRYVIADDGNLWLYDHSRGCCHVRVDKEGRFSCERFRTEDNTLPSNHVTFVVQDRNNRAWVGTDRGLVNIREGKPHAVVKDKAITCAQQMKDGSTYFVSEEGCVYKTHKSGSLNIFTPTSKLPVKVRSVACDGKQLVLATNGATYRFDTQSGQLSPHPTIHIDNAQVVEDNRGNKVVFDYNGTDLWYMTPERTFHLTNIYNADLVRQSGGGRFKFIYGSNGYIWISTYSNGLFAYNRETGQMRHYTVTGTGYPMISTNFLQNIYEDYSGHIWVCQENQGVRCIGNVSQQRDVRYFTSADDQSHANTIRLIHPFEDKMYVGNRQNGLWTTDSQLNITNRDNPYGDDVVAMATDPLGRLWAGTRNRGVFVDGQPLTPAIKGKVSDILCDRQGRIWISIFDGSVYLVMPQQDGTRKVRPFFLQEHAIAQPRSMVESHDGHIWLCSNRGVYRFQPAELIKDSTAYQHINVSGANSNSDEVHCIFEDSRHRIWAGTTGYGLAVIDSGGHVTRRYTDKDGLPNNSVESIVEDQKGCIWAGTDYGLAKYTESDDRFNAFFLANTSLGLMYTEGCAIRLADGRLAMGTLHGMQVFNPDDIKPRSAVFPLSLTDIRINGASVLSIGNSSDLVSGIVRQHQMELSHDQNSLTFYFSAFEYVTTQVIKYSYRLEGYDKQWSEPSTENFATYKDLKPGHYTLHIRSYNTYGVQSEHKALLDITIHQPWWNTWWAWLIYLLVIGGVVWTAWRHFQQVNDLRNKIKVENQLTEYKLRFFTNISHEFRTPLTIIRGAMDRINAQGEIPSALRQPVSSMQKSTDRLMRLINELLVFRKIQNQKLSLQLEETDVVDFLRNIFLTFKETAENRQISYNFTTFAREYKMYIDRNFVDKMAYNLLSNAFKYTGRKKEITMRLKQEGDRLKMMVEDTGIGITKEKQASLFTRFNQSEFSRDSIGVGLHMVQELVRVHHGEISFEENPVGGSIFTITLPTDQSVYGKSDFLKENEQLVQATDNTQQPSPVTYKEMAMPPMNDHRVLVVDDDDDVREFLNNELRRYFVIDLAYNGEEALEKIKAERPSLVISDVKMPVMNGFELTRKIRQDQELADLPIILLTAISDEEKVVKGTEYGADAYISKPFNIKVLISKCRSLIEQRERLKNRYAKEVVGQAPLSDLIVDDADKKFKDRFEMWIYSHLSNPNMQFMDLADSMKMGRTTFFKKVKQVTGMAPHEYIKKARMEKAAELLSDPTNSISEVAYQTGFDDPNYFSRTFKNYFGVTATQFKKGGKAVSPNGTPPAKES